MTRFWSRITLPFRATSSNDVKKKKLPTIAVPEYVKRTTTQHLLKDSIIYSKHLVRVEHLEREYGHLKQKKHHWKQLEPFVHVWYCELERVCQQSQVALALLQRQLEELSCTLHAISSSLKNRNPHSLKTVHQFIDSNLKQWQAQKPWLDDPFTEHSLEQREQAFQARYQDLDCSMQQALKINKQLSSKLSLCIHNLYTFQKDLCLFSYYLSTQFAVLFLFLKPLHHYEALLLQLLYSRFQQRHAHLQKPYHTLMQQMQQMLTQCMPPSRDTLTCAVCLGLLQQPTVLSVCGHTFCRGCVQRLFCAKCYRSRRNRRVLQRLSESLRRQCVPVIYCLCDTEKKGACPLCRALFGGSDCVKDEALDLIMNIYYPSNKEEEQEEDQGEKRKRPSRANRMVSEMQRWSHRLSVSTISYESVVAHQDMVELTRRSWMF